VTFRSLCKIVDDRRLISVAITALAGTFLCGLATVTLIKGIGTSNI
jgi:hypothetical protein